jgi:elongation factor G
MERALPGDVVALKCRQRLRTGETLFTLGHPMRLEPAHFPRPVLTMAIEPRSHVEAAAVERGVQELATDDPTLVVDRDEDSGRLLVSGMGELHLEVFGSRLRQVVGDRMRFGKPSVAYLETVVGPGRGSAKCRAGGEGSPWAAVTVEVEPAWGGAQVESAVRDRAEAIALAGELRSRLRSGLSGPYPAADLLVRLVEVAGDAAGEEGAVLFLEALTVATRKAMAAAGRRLLEPIMAFAVECPADSLSAVLADLRSRRAQIEGVEAGEGLARVRGEVRLEAMLGYATQLRSLTRGLGTVSLRPRRFGPRAES